MNDIDPNRDPDEQDDDLSEENADVSEPESVDESDAEADATDVEAEQDEVADDEYEDDDDDEYEDDDDEGYEYEEEQEQLEVEADAESDDVEEADDEDGDVEEADDEDGDDEVNSREDLDEQESEDEAFEDEEEIEEAEEDSFEDDGDLEEEDEELDDDDENVAAGHGDEVIARDQGSESDPSSGDKVSEPDGPTETDRRDETASVTLPPIPIEDHPAPRQPMSGDSSGIRRADRDGLETWDAMAGRANAFGFGFEPLVEALQAAAEEYLGDAAAQQVVGDDDDRLLQQFQDWLGESSALHPDSLHLTASADLAVETAIRLARCRRPGAYRIVTLVGSDHGRTGVCRTASGRPELQEGYGPMMAGFAHVPSGDLKAVGAVIDEQTAAVLVSPIDLEDSARPIDPDFMVGLRKLCHDHDLLLIVDESRLGLGSAGTPLVIESIADVAVDAVILGAGLFGGMPGGVVLSTNKMTGRPTTETGIPILSAVASTMLQQLRQQEFPQAAIETAREFAVALAQRIEGFEFVRDLIATGTTIGIELDVEAGELIGAAARRGLRIESAGETSIRMQLPLKLDRRQSVSLLQILGESMEVVERATANLGI